MEQLDAASASIAKEICVSYILLRLRRLLLDVEILWTKLHNDMRRNRPMLFIITWTLAGILYLPIFILAWFLHMAARILLALSYYGLLNPKYGKEVFISLFKFNPML